MNDTPSLRIVHCFRSPVGGIFRHVRDLIEVQASQGHQIGILCDSNTGGEYEDALFETISDNLSLGLHRIPMQRKIGASDIGALWKSFQGIRKLRPDIIHSHGAKGGAYARLIGFAMRLTGSKVARLYCPHGGSIHFDASSLQGRVYFTLERLLERSTDRLIFVSNYEKQGYFDKVGKPHCPYSVIYNGLKEDEFIPVNIKSDAADFLYIGMMRDLKGPDLFIDALPIVEDALGRKITAHMVGDGPDTERYIETVKSKELDDRVKFHPPMPARDAFATANVVVVPSRAESLPYIVLETVAAARPLVVTNVGGIGEIFQGDTADLVKPDDVQALASAMVAMILDKDAEANALQKSAILRGKFSSSLMASSVNQAYLAAINA